VSGAQGFKEDIDAIVRDLPCKVIPHHNFAMFSIRELLGFYKQILRDKLSDDFKAIHPNWDWWVDDFKAIYPNWDWWVDEIVDACEEGEDNDAAYGAIEFAVVGTDGSTCFGLDKKFEKQQELAKQYAAEWADIITDYTIGARSIRSVIILALMDLIDAFDEESDRRIPKYYWYYDLTLERRHDRHGRVGYFGVGDVLSVRLCADDGDGRSLGAFPLGGGRKSQALRL
jgi:hypothetical protein